MEENTNANKIEDKTEEPRQKHMYDNLNVSLKQLDIFIGIMVILLVTVLVMGIIRS